MNKDELLALADRASKIDPHSFTMYQSSSNDIADCAHAVEELRDILVDTLRALAGEKGEHRYTAQQADMEQRRDENARLSLLMGRFAKKGEGEGG